jgi:DNA-binding protein YbaB
MMSDHPVVASAVSGPGRNRSDVSRPVACQAILIDMMDALPDELRGSLVEYERIAEQVRAMRDGIEGIRATTHSDDGLVTAVVGGRGELLELELDPRVFREQDAAGLAETILAVVRDAEQEAERDAVRFAEQLIPARQRNADVDPVFDPVLHLLDKRK